MSSTWVYPLAKSPTTSSCALHIRCNNYCDVESIRHVFSGAGAELLISWDGSFVLASAFTLNVLTKALEPSLVTHILYIHRNGNSDWDLFSKQYSLSEHGPNNCENEISVQIRFLFGFPIRLLLRWPMLKQLRPWFNITNSLQRWLTIKSSLYECLRDTRSYSLR